jgi:hypothetical protein
MTRDAHSDEPRNVPAEEVRRMLRMVEWGRSIKGNVTSKDGRFRIEIDRDVRTTTVAYRLHDASRPSTWFPTQRDAKDYADAVLAKEERERIVRFYGNLP